MDVTNWDNREIIKVLTARNKITQKELTNLLEVKNDTNIPQSTFANKLMNNRMRVKELQQICEILNYSLLIVPKN